MKMSEKIPKFVLWSLLGIFILIIIGMSPIGMMGMEGMGLIRQIVIFVSFTSWILFFLLGGILIILTLKSKVEGKLKVFLLLTGLSSMGFLIGVILHNLLYALSILLEHIIVLKYLMEILHVTFFFISVPLSPIGFLVGAIGSIILFRKRGGK